MEKKNKILVVEDDHLIGADIISALESFGYETEGPIAKGEDVLDRIDVIKPDFVLMDIELEGKLDGIETARAIQKKTSVPVVFLTALNDEGTLQRAKLENSYGYLIKPFNAQELHSMIQLTIHRLAGKTSAQKQPVELEIHPEITNIEDFKSHDENNKLFEFLSKHSLFHEIPADLVKKLSQSCAVREFDGGSYITLEGEPISAGFIPISGRVSITKTSESGKELIVALLAPGDSFGLFYLIDSFDSTTAARAQIDSKVLWIPKAEWKNICAHSPLLYRNLLDAVTDRLITAHTLSSSIAHTRVESRIANILLSLLPNFGKSYNHSSNDARIYITRKELSELTGTTPETAIRVTKQLEREEILDLTKPGIIKIPNINSLREIIGR
jgi:CRP-like cAMP-binding protein/AmiR/NasT family two-component response regulator